MDTYYNSSPNDLIISGIFDQKKESDKRNKKITNMINDIIKKVREIEKKCKTEVEEKMNNNSKNPNVNVIKKLKNK